MGMKKGIMVSSLCLILLATAILIYRGGSVPPSHQPAPQKKDFYSLDRAIAVYRIIEEYTRGLKEEEKRSLVRAIMEESRRHRLDPLFVLAVIETESTYYHRARSRKGARGLMQIRYYVGKGLAEEMGMAWKGRETLYNPVDNVRLGVYYLSKLIERFGSVEIALAAYNYGPTYIARLMARGQRLPLYYSRKVLTNYRDLLEVQKRYLLVDRRAGEHIRVALNINRYSERIPNSLATGVRE